MATRANSTYLEDAKGRRISVARMTVAGGVSAALIFALCWIGTFIPFSSPTHAFIALFTPAPIQSVEALGEGSLWSLLFGGLSLALFATVYNLFAALERR